MIPPMNLSRHMNLWRGMGCEIFFIKVIAVVPKGSAALNLLKNSYQCGLSIPYNNVYFYRVES